MPARQSIVAPPPSSKTRTTLLIIFLVVVILLTLWQLGRAFSHGFLMSQKHEGVVVSGEAAGQRTGGRGSWIGEPMFNYVVKDTGTDTLLQVNHVSELYKTGDAVAVYTYPDGTEGHFKTGFAAFFSHDLGSTGRQGILTAISTFFLPLLLLLLVDMVKNNFRKSSSGRQ